MPRFFFNSDKHADIDGFELESVAVAKCEAIKLAGAIICDDADSFWDNAEWTMTMTDERRLTLFQIHVFGTEAPVLQHTKPR